MLARGFAEVLLDKGYDLDAPVMLESLRVLVTTRHFIPRINTVIARSEWSSAVVRELMLLSDVSDATLDIDAQTAGVMDALGGEIERSSWSPETEYLSGADELVIDAGVTPGYHIGAPVGSRGASPGPTLSTAIGYPVMRVRDMLEGDARDHRVFGLLHIENADALLCVRVEMTGIVH